jgi:uncharacterized protein
VSGDPWTYPVAFAAALIISAVTSPAGLSGAVLLLPFQVSVLGTPSPAVTPTNLLYNVVATPGALYRYWRQGQTGGVLTRQLLLGTLPGVIAGSVIRVELLPGPQAADAIIAVVLIPLGTSLVVRKAATNPSGAAALLPLVPIAAIVGCIGGIYGIGGGSILAPILTGAGRSPTDVAPATLASTLATSIAGVATFVVLAGLHGSVAPDWGIGIALGVGGLIGGYCGARLQPRLPEETIRRVLGELLPASVCGTPIWPGGADPFHRASIARAGQFQAVRASSSGPGRVAASTHTFTPVPVTSTDNAEVDGSIPSSPTKIPGRRPLFFRDGSNRAVLCSYSVWHDRVTESACALSLHSPTVANSRGTSRGDPAN